jgi:hypothetical protein
MNHRWGQHVTMASAEQDRDPSCRPSLTPPRQGKRCGALPTSPKAFATGSTLTLLEPAPQFPLQSHGIEHLTGTAFVPYEQEIDKLAIPYQISSPEAAWFERQAPRPFQSRFLQPLRCTLCVSGENIE